MNVTTRLGLSLAPLLRSTCPFRSRSDSRWLGVVPSRDKVLSSAASICAIAWFSLVFVAKPEVNRGRLTLLIGSPSGLDGQCDCCLRPSLRWLSHEASSRVPSLLCLGGHAIRASH